MHMRRSVCPVVGSFQQPHRTDVQETEYSASSANAGAARGQGIGQAPVGLPQSRQVPFRANRTQDIEEGINGLIILLLDKKFCPLFVHLNHRKLGQAAHFVPLSC